MCVGEIKRCRPYFIKVLAGILGRDSRHTILAEVVERELRGRKHTVGEGKKSVTELAIVHTVPNDHQMRGHALFYWRNPSVTEDMPEVKGAHLEAENEAPSRSRWSAGQQSTGLCKPQSQL